ncbi:uncharacterized protein LOC141858796 [Brevipalpus obovatus]|uniref:uncharacterized protein LOC141858796 n=1 Tax=Brevipalpus obovatus TaxID=246614 RepID=UPI003D9F7B03
MNLKRMIFIYCGILIPASTYGLIDPERSSISTDILRRHVNLLSLGFGRVFWESLKTGQQSNLNAIASTRCIQSLKEILFQMEKGNESALRMITASGQLPKNYFLGILADLGGFDQCLYDGSELDTHHSIEFGGQYCLAALEPRYPSNLSLLNHEGSDTNFHRRWRRLFPQEFEWRYNVSIYIGLCISALCTSAEAGSIIKNAMQPYSWELVNEPSCQTEENFVQALMKAPFSQRLSFAFICILITVVLVATIFCSRKKHDPSQNNLSMEFFRCFSLQKTMEMLFRRPIAIQMPVISIFRLILTVAVILIHCISWHTSIKAFLLTRMDGTISKTMKSWLAQPLLNTWYTESIIMLGGANWIIKVWRETTGQTPLYSFVRIVFSRFKSDFIPLLAVICINISLPLIGSGPIYKSLTENQSDICSKNFIYSLLHITNFVGGSKMCASHTWSMSVELQLLAIACVVIFAYKRNFGYGLSLNLILLASGTGYLFFVFYTSDIPAHQTILPIDQSKLQRFVDMYYFTTGGHLWSYMFALLVIAMIFFKVNERTSQNVLEKFGSLINLLVVAQLFSTGLWNVIDLKINNFWKAIYVVVYQYIGAAFWSFHFYTRRIIINAGVPSSLMNRRHYTEKMDRGFWLLERSDVEENVNRRKLSHAENQVDFLSRRRAYLRIVEKENSILALGTTQSVTVFLRILKSTYFIHVSFLTWYLAQRRETFPFRWTSQVIMFSGMAVGSIVSGVIFYLLVLGPTESLLSLDRRRKTLKSHHS